MKKVWAYLFLFGVILLALCWRLETFPPFSLWWDEGWTLMVARNWVERGHYGLLLNGQPRSPGLSGPFTVAAPAAFSMRMFGVGVWQGRLPVALMGLGMVIALFLLGRELMDSRLGWGAVFVILLMSPHPMVNPIYMGRQAMAEVPMLFFLLMGYFCFVKSASRWEWIGAAVLFWGFALLTKVQLLPFFALGLAIALLLALLKHRWRIAAWFVIGLGGAYMASRVFAGLWAWAIRNHTIEVEMLPGLMQALALTLNSLSRRSALLAVILFGLPTAWSLIYVLKNLYNSADVEKRSYFIRLVWIALAISCGSWFLWYLCFSIGWVRYLMPVISVGSLFVSRMLYDLSDGFNLRRAVPKAGAAILRLKLWGQEAAAFWGFLVTALMVLMTVSQCYWGFVSPADQALSQTVRFLNTQIPSDALVECYESDILFLLERPYHYPPDEISVAILRQGADPSRRLDYDPLLADPDYLVIGRFARSVLLYDRALQTGQFQSIARFGDYEIYVRVDR